MGRTTFNSYVYEQQAKARAASSTPTFANTAKAQATGQWDLPKILDISGRYYVCRDTKERPKKTPIWIGFDETGSMTIAPKKMQEALPQVIPLLQKDGYCNNPDLSVSCFGNQNVDPVPFQVSQFESDNMIDEALRSMLLVGGGADGGWFEHPETLLAVYAYLTRTDAYEKRGETGYGFVISDEGINEQLDVRFFNDYFKPTEKLTGTYTTKRIMEDVSKLYEMFYIIPHDTSGWNEPQILNTWKEHFDDQHFLHVEDSSQIPQLIAATIAVREGTRSVSQIKQDLIGSGSSAMLANSVEKAVAVVAAGSKGAITTGLPKSKSGKTTVNRLS
jgi:hypothetical protein